MDKVLYLAMNGAKHVAWQQATTANNLANIHTHGFKADQAVFRALPVIGEGSPTRVYSVDNSIGTDFSQGPLEQTGNDHDLSLGTPGFFAVQGPDGAEAYTRDGSFVVDAAGNLRNRAGLMLLGEGGPIQVPADSRVSVSVQGTVSVAATSGADQAVTEVGRLKLVNPTSKEVYKGNDGLFHINGGGTAPAANEQVKVVAGSLEASNVSSVDAMVQMISHARQYDLNIKMMQTAEQNARSATQILSLNA